MVPHRVSMTLALIKAYGLLDDMDRLRVAPATEEDLELAHDPEFIRFLRDLTPADYNADAKTQREAAEKYKLGEVWNELTHCVTNDNPVIENLWDYCQRYAGGSLAAARALASGRYKIAINWSGGMHHACKGKAGGFCYVNDIVVAIKALLDGGQFKRVLYLDIDAHHGDGVETAFMEDSRVLTVSFHQFGGEFFPRTGDAVDVGELPAGDDGVCPTLINVPLQAGTRDGRYHQLFGPIVDRVMAVFEPDAVVMQCGADSLAGDRLASLGLSVRGHAKCVSIVKGYGLPLLLLGGGGYTINHVASCWCYETAVAIGKEIPDAIPQHGYQNYYKSQGYKLHYHKEDSSSRKNRDMRSKDKITLDKVMNHLDRLSLELMPKPRPSEQLDEQPPRAPPPHTDDGDDALVDRSPWDEDAVERLHQRCGEKMLHEFFTRLGRKHPKRI
ncbi:histone deacetylase 1-like [Miscanthus floridulus]|uniref:histone deacetylase 1-like n=1 Tax=Miscanthus floridulus TaxID=154761 RepID=UPI003458D3E6